MPEARYPACTVPHSQRLYCRAPVCVYIETQPPPCYLPVSSQSQSSPRGEEKSSMYSMPSSSVFFYSFFTKCKNGGSPVFMQMVNVGL